MFGTEFEDELGQGAVTLKKLRENLGNCLDFDEEDDIVCEIATHLIQLGDSKKVS